MALFKCKMCGGDLEITKGATIAECEYCGTKQTVPKAMDENLQNLFNRANTLRIKSEFDKAEKLYEKIIQADTTQSEAYWGLILCKYGIEYVDDPATFKKIPTCHRASYDSIIADDDYKSALENADMSQRAIYEEQAKEIDRIQKDILALAQKEETYDVFICYKETDADGRRTQDSVIANDIYYQLTNEGFKVFYAAITLEGKLGSAYEPIIFAALNSAKVMLSIGTKPEYFNAVWVKNEWSRFLKIIKKDRSKLLIPCYRDMDAYEIPEEFAHLQAQDMAKIGFINDLVRGIKKVVKKDEPKQTTVVKETVISTGNANTAPLLKRAFMFLEDGDWNSANEYCEKVLDQDPECAQAYLGKLMAELRVNRQDMLKNCPQPFDNQNNYQKAMRFGDQKLKSELEGYIDHIKVRNENARLEAQYQEILKEMQNATTESAYNNAAARFAQMGAYKDATSLSKECKQKSQAIRYASIIRLMNKATTESEYKNAANYFTQMGEYKDAAAWADECLRKAEAARIEAEEMAERARKDQIYSFANKLKAYDQIDSVMKAIAEFQKIPHWRNADDLIVECEHRLEELKAIAQEKERLAKIARAEAEKRAKRNKKIAIITTPIVCAVIAFIIVLNTVIIPNGKYNDAIALMDAGKYSEAISAFEALGNYRDSVNKIEECLEGKYNDAIALMNAGKYDEAITMFKGLGGIYKDNVNKIMECNTAIKYNDAIALMDAGKYSEAISAFEALEGYKDSANKITECNTAILDIKYEEAVSLMEAGKYTEAISAFEALEGYKDSANKITECNTAILDIKYEEAVSLMEAGNIIEAYEALVELDGYKDSADKANSIYDKYKFEKLKVAKVGDYVLFGAYEQDNNTSNGKEDIEWLVLDVKDGKALVISKYALDCEPYNTRLTDIFWWSCTLRKWLNNDFINAAFSADEKAMIPTVTVDYIANPGNATQDQVFLLSITEVNKYFNSDSARQCKPTDYADANGAYVSGTNGNCRWWLRSPGHDYYVAASVLYEGDVHELGRYVDACDVAVRPALWIDLTLLDASNP